MRRGFTLGVLLLAIVLQLSAPSTQAQTMIPSAEQLEALRNLPPEEREEILEALGMGGSGEDSARGQTRDRGLEDSSGLRRRLRTVREFEDPRVLKVEDTLLVQIDFPGRLPPRPVTPVGVPPELAGGQPLPQLPAQPQASTPAQPGTSPQEMTPEERQRLQELIDLVRAKNPYKLDRNGVLFLPGFGTAGIALAGLSEDLATLRLQSEPAFSGLEVRVVRLPLEKAGPEGLKPFGYELFGDLAPSTFAPVTEVPVPADYVLGPGDQLRVQLYGNQNRNLTLTVSREGQINFPELGPIVVAGQRFEAAQQDIESRVERQMIGVRASVSMGRTRAIRVFVLGEVNYPGTYTVSGLATVTSALFASGGIKPIGSLRKIQLKRQGRTVSELDLYDMLLDGDTGDDAQLLPGDVIFIPPVGPTVSVDGEVKRPAIYELDGEASVGDLIRLAGGLTTEADTSHATLARIDEQGRRIVTAVNLATGGDLARPLRTGDLLRVARLRPQIDSGVMLQGHVHRPGPYAYREGMRLTDVIGTVNELRPNADLRYVLIRRELEPDRRIVAVSADLAAALRAPGSEADIALQPRDEILVFDLESGRERVIRPLLDELRLQGRLDNPTQIVRIDGRVKLPGEYPLEPDMTVADLIRAGGTLQDAAYGGKAELTRYEVVGGESRQTELIEIDLAAVLRGDPGADVRLQPFDFLNIKEIPEWGTQETVTLQGEVRFPGTYPIRRGETLQSVIARAGGLTDFAFPDGAVFTRAELREREQQQLDMLAERLQNDLSSLALQGAAANPGQAAGLLQVGQSLLTQIRASTAVGRLVIDLERAMNAPRGSTAEIVLRHGDQLVVPKVRQEIMVLGEVQNATSHLYRPELDRDDYIALSGGTTRRADRSKIYVVRANGSVVSAEGSRWFHRGSRVDIQPGDAVVVPLDTERTPMLPLWQSVTQILYNTAVALAAIGSL